MCVCVLHDGLMCPVPTAQYFSVAVLFQVFEAMSQYDRSE